MKVIRKIIYYFIAFLLICFIIPALLTNRKEETSNIPAENNDIKSVSLYEYKKYASIKLLHTKSNEIEEVPIDDYLCNVVAGEMPANFELEALKAQAVVARTYTIYQINHNNGKHGEADICDDSTCCQAWISKEERFEKWEEEERESNWEKIKNAVDSTAGKVIVYNGEPIDAFFHSNSGGKTEIPVNVWGGADYPYLQSVETAGEEAYTQYSSDVTLSKEELINKLKEKHSEIEIDYSVEDSIKVLDYTDGGRVRTIRFGNIEISGVEARSILGLKSANFEIQIDGDNIKFLVKGYGHGVGMSQTGADSMAKEGKNYEEIIKHFYTNVEILDINLI